MSDERQPVRTIGSLLAGIVVALTVPLTTCLVWFRWQVLESDRAVATVRPLGGNDAVREDIVSVVTSELEGRVRQFEQLPDAAVVRSAIDQLGGLPAAIELIRARLEQFVFSSRFLVVWETVVSEGYPRLIRLVRGESGEVLNLAGGDVTIDVSALAAAIDAVSAGVTGTTTTVGDLIGVVGDDEPIYLPLFHYEALGWFEWIARHTEPLLVGSVLVLVVAIVALVGLARKRTRAIGLTAAGTLVGFAATTVWAETMLDKRLGEIRDVNGQDLAARFVDALLDSLYRGFALGAAIMVVILLLALLPRQTPSRMEQRNVTRPVAD